jgi:triphosphoribosyl-dephospho-CoA synthase
LNAEGSSADIARAFRAACLAELEALKPGNVHRFAEDRRMRLAEFENSADAAAPFIAAAGRGVGVRIRKAAEATAAVAGTNTNLGIILLAAPLAAASQETGGAPLRTRLEAVLTGLTVEDAREAYIGIRAARPGGLGEVSEHDIAEDPSVSLREAMQAAAKRDRIAWNYGHGFADIFERGLPWLEAAETRWGKTAWTAASVYLGFLGSIPDSLIARKFGVECAAEIRDEAAPLNRALQRAERPESQQAALLALDRALRRRGLNPGTSADLTVATLFAEALQRLESPE